MLNAKKKDNPAVALLVLAVVAVFVVSRSDVPGSVMAALRTAVDRVADVVASPGLVVAVVLLVVLVVATRLYLTRRTLSTRISYSVLPTDSFDPSAEALSSFARQLSSVPRVVGGWMDRRASGVRIRLASTGEGRMVYQLEVPSRSRSVLQAAAGAYAELELRPGEDKADTPAGGAGEPEQGSGGERVEPLPALEGDPDGEGELAAAHAYATRAPEGEELPPVRLEGDGPDPLGIDDREALGDVPEETSPWWDGDPGSERP